MAPALRRRNTEAGGGQFWLAVDPEHYQFVLPGQAIKSAQAAARRAGQGSGPGATQADRRAREQEEGLIAGS